MKNECLDVGWGEMMCGCLGLMSCTYHYMKELKEHSPNAYRNLISKYPMYKLNILKGEMNKRIEEMHELNKDQ